MSFNGQTPESLLPRSDSKNPATTCKGITSNGRPCRRALAAGTVSALSGIIAVLTEENAAAFYCWQHKDQAERLRLLGSKTTKLYPLKEKSSIDTLVDRIGVLNLDHDLSDKNREKRRGQNVGVKKKRRDTLPSGWNDMTSPLMSVPEDLISSSEKHHEVKMTRKPKLENQHGRSNVKVSWACCIQADDYDDDLPPARRYREDQNHNNRPNNQINRPAMQKYPNTTIPNPMQRPSATPNPIKSQSQSQSSSQKSQTQTLLSLIPTSLSPQITSLLLTELSRPISPADESGYIYIFGLHLQHQRTK